MFSHRVDFDYSPISMTFMQGLECGHYLLGGAEGKI